jgi:excisionase family DNA binding protein
MTLEEVASALRLSVSLIYRVVHSGQLRAFRFGKRCYRVSAEELERYKTERVETKTVFARGTVQHTQDSGGTFRHLRIIPQLARRKRRDDLGQDERTAP